MGTGSATRLKGSINLLEVVNSFIMAPLKSTFLLKWWLQSLGAQIADDVTVDTTEISDPDLVTMRPGVVLKSEKVRLLTGLCAALCYACAG